MILTKLLCQFPELRFVLHQQTMQLHSQHLCLNWIIVIQLIEFYFHLTVAYFLLIFHLSVSYSICFHHFPIIFINLVYFRQHILKLCQFFSMSSFSNSLSGGSFQIFKSISSETIWGNSWFVLLRSSCSLALFWNINIHY